MSVSQPLNIKQFREFMSITLVILLCLVFLDYSCSANIIQISKLKIIFFKIGEILKALYFTLLIITLYYHSKSRIINKNILLDDYKKYFLFILTFILIALLIFINNMSPYIIKYAYIPIFLVANITSGILVLNYTDSDTNLNNKLQDFTIDKYPSNKETCIVLKVKGGYLNINNPFRSGLIVGGAGAGKSASIIEPMIFDATKKNFSILLYDFKFPTLGNYLYSCFYYHSITNHKLFSISFSDVTKSHRFNPIDPRLLYTSTYAEEYSWTLYSNLDKDGAKKGGFFPESASSLLKAVIWFMKKNHPEYCTLPHVINIILNAETNILVDMLTSDEETSGMCKPIKEAASKKEAGAQLAGVVGSLTMQLSKINTPEANWVLTGDEFTLDLNNKDNPKSLILGNSPQIEQALTPILAFICNIALKLMNDKNKNPSLVMIDEAPTVTIPNLEKLPATARSNKLGVFLSWQDFSQPDKYQGKETREAIVSNLATQFYGQISSQQTAEYVSKLFGKKYIEVKSTNKGVSSSDSGESDSSGRSISEQQREIVSSQELITLPTGTFFGKTVESNNNWFKLSFVRIEDQEEFKDFKVNNIPSFVRTFDLDSSDELGIKKEYEYYRFNPETIFTSKNKNIEDLIYKFDYYGKDEIEISSDFYEELFKIIASNKSEEKIYNIINQNFSKVQKDVNRIIQYYTKNTAS